MKIEIETTSYNQRRYGKPWIARITFDGTGRAQYAWGVWLGSPGADGLLLIDAEPGDIIARGQKDNRGNNTSNYMYQVQADGTRQPIADRVAAYRLWAARTSA